MLAMLWVYIMLWNGYDMQFNNVDFAMDSKTTHDAFHSHKDDVSEFTQSFRLVNLSSPINSQTLELSLLGDKQMQLLVRLQERPHY